MSDSTTTSKAKQLASLEDDIDRLLASPAPEYGQLLERKNNPQKNDATGKLLLDPKSVFVASTPSRPIKSPSSILARMQNNKPAVATPLKESSRIIVVSDDDSEEDQEEEDQEEEQEEEEQEEPYAEEDSEDNEEANLSKTLQSMKLTANLLPFSNNDVFTTGSDNEESLASILLTPARTDSRHKQKEYSESDTESENEKDEDSEQSDTDASPQTAVKALLGDQFNRNDGRTSAERAHALFSHQKNHRIVSTTVARNTKTHDHYRNTVLDTPSLAPKKPVPPFLTPSRQSFTFRDDNVKSNRNELQLGAPSTSKAAIKQNTLYTLPPAPAPAPSTISKPSNSAIPISTPMQPRPKQPQFLPARPDPPFMKSKEPQLFINAKHPHRPIKVPSTPNVPRNRINNELSLHAVNSPFWNNSATTSVMNPKAYEPEVLDLRTPANQQTGPAFRSTPFGTPTSRSRARPTPTPKRDTEKDIRNLMASIGDDTDEDPLTAEEPWMRKQELGTYRGGILADDVNGSRQDVQTIALMLANSSLDRKQKTTLIIAPLAVIRQWESECQSKAVKGRLSVYVHHGPKRITDPERLRLFDVVVTTYSTAASEFPRYITGKSSESTIAEALEGDGVGALFRTLWYRVVLDEAQNIKNASTRSAIACVNLKAKYRWCLTGTPIQNNLDELYSLLRFLQHPMFPDRPSFQAKITATLASDYETTMKRLQVILKAILLRRTKNSTINGKPLLTLPERYVEPVEVEFSAHERRIYDALELKMSQNFNDIFKTGKLQTSYTKMITLLLRLRQACNHISLVDQSLITEGDQQNMKMTTTESEGTGTEGTVGDLMDAFKILAVDKTQSKVCAVCFERLYDEETTHCADCAEKFRLKQFESAKVAKMISTLQQIRSKDTTLKRLFSRRQNKFKYVRYDGSMTNTQRERALQQIREDDNTTVMLISLLCGSTGLNLICATLEEQAIDRVHRIGQQKPVHVYKITVSDTVENRIRALAQGALGENPSLSVGKLSVDDFFYLFQVQPSTSTGASTSGSASTSSKQYIK
ncbi:SNF2 family N-terminal domain-containing protein [Syncephalis plumigaleata]|nr:SNF2 family N-terminal domain-containing protein [Syncephalis plumigaleata]